MIEIGKAHILSLVSHLRDNLPSHVFGITCRFAAVPQAGHTNPGAIAIEITTVGLYDDKHLLHDVVSWLELDEIGSNDMFAQAVNETMFAHRMAHQRTQDELDGVGPGGKVRK